MDVTFDGGEFEQRDPEVGGQFLLRRVAAEAVGERLFGCTTLACFDPHRAAGPIMTAEFVDNSAADPHARVARERNSTLGVKAAGGLGEGHHASRREVVTTDVAR